jgi:hypothetical protein
MLQRIRQGDGDGVRGRAGVRGVELALPGI